MKKFVSIITLIFVVGLSLVGCGKEEAPKVESEVPSSSESSVTVDYKTTVPNVGASFTGGSMKLVEMTDSKYHVRITDCDLEAYNAFIEKCKATYPNVKTNMDYARGQHSFEAYTADGSYKMGVYFYTDENSNPTYIDIICEYKLD